MQFVNCIFSQAYLRRGTASSCESTGKNIIKMKWHKKLRTNYKQLRLKIFKKLRTASLNPEFIGSYKISVWYIGTCSQLVIGFNPTQPE